MSLSCSCEYEPDAGDTYWYPPRDFSIYDAKRATKCKSCGDRIKPGDDCGEFTRFKVPFDDVECAIYGDDGEIPRASHYHCYRCTGLFLSLDELGYCMRPDDDMRELVKEYADEHTGKPL